MSRIELKLEPCTLEEATYVEMNGVVYKVAGNICRYNIGLRWVEEGVWIPIELFPILGIKTLKEIKPEPIEFEATFVKHDGQWHTLAILNDNFAYLNNKRVRFKCVEILEDEK